MSEKNYKLYMHTSPSGKIYFGITGTSVARRWKNGKGYIKNNYFTNAINKYGWDNIEHLVLAENLTKEEAEHYEEVLIDYFNTTNPDKGYNHSSGGECNLHSEETKQKMSEKRNRPEHNLSISLARRKVHAIYNDYYDLEPIEIPMTILIRDYYEQLIAQGDIDTLFRAIYPTIVNIAEENEDISELVEVFMKAINTYEPNTGNDFDYHWKLKVYSYMSHKNEGLVYKFNRSIIYGKEYNLFHIPDTEANELAKIIEEIVNTSKFTPREKDIYIRITLKDYKACEIVEELNSCTQYVSMTMSKVNNYVKTKLIELGYSYDNTIEKYKRHSIDKAKKVQCHTGEIFDSIAEAKEWIGVAGIIDCLKGRSKTSGKHPITGERLRWSYVED